MNNKRGRIFLGKTLTMLCISAFFFSYHSYATDKFICVDIVTYYEPYQVPYQNIEQNLPYFNGNGTYVEVFMYGPTPEETADRFCYNLSIPYLIFSTSLRSNYFTNGGQIGCDRAHESDPNQTSLSHYGCKLYKESCPVEVGADQPFDAVKQDGTCECSDPNYEARDNPTGSPPEVGCFLIDSEDEDDADKDDGCGDNNTDNPCNVATGNKYKSQTDVSGSLSFTRSYNSRNLVDLGLGKGWRSGYQKRLIVSGDSLTLASGTGRGEPWNKQSGNWVGDADSDFIVTEDASSFTITKQNGDVEAYNTSGQLVSETDSQGKQTKYAYEANSQLITATNHFGETLSFTYDANGHLQTVTDAVGAVYTYAYDANDNLVTVIYPDTTTGDDSDNPRKIYHYENVDYPNHLTGITDENGDRYQSYAYDASGKAIQSGKASTSSAVGQERIQLDYQDEGQE